MVHDDPIPVASAVPPGVHHAAGIGDADRRAKWRSDIDSGVPPREVGRDRTAGRPLQAPSGDDRSCGHRRCGRRWPWRRRRTRRGGRARPRCRDGGAHNRRLRAHGDRQLSAGHHNPAVRWKRFAGAEAVGIDNRGRLYLEPRGDAIKRVARLDKVRHARHGRDT